LDNSQNLKKLIRYKSCENFRRELYSIKELPENEMDQEADIQKLREEFFDFFVCFFILEIQKKIKKRQPPLSKNKRNF
jgi:hypothetical protein